MNKAMMLVVVGAVAVLIGVGAYQRGQETAEPPSVAQSPAPAPSALQLPSPEECEGLQCELLRRERRSVTPKRLREDCLIDAPAAEARYGSDVAIVGTGQVQSVSSASEGTTVLLRAGTLDTETVSFDVPPEVIEKLGTGMNVVFFCFGGVDCADGVQVKDCQWAWGL